MKCSLCQHDNRPGAKFCEECAAPVARACGSCGAQLSSTAKFCSKCAHPTGSSSASADPTTLRFTSPETYTPKYLAARILNSKAGPEGERKQLTILFDPAGPSGPRATARTGHGGPARKIHPQAIGPVTDARLIWVFQVAPQVIGCHNDIFNSRAASLMLALIQISGAVMSLAQHWTQSFDAGCEGSDDFDDAR